MNFCSLDVWQVKEGGYDQKVNETVSVVGARATELGQKTWGIMRGVMAMASQTVEQYTKEPGRSSYEDSHSDTLSGGHNEEPYQEFNSGGNAWNNNWNNEKTQTSKGRDSWDDWDDDSKQGGQTEAYNTGNSSHNGHSNHNNNKNVSAQQNRSQSSATTTATQSTKAATGGDSWTGWDDQDANDDVDTFFSVDHKADHKKSDGWNDWNDNDVKWTEGGFK